MTATCCEGGPLLLRCQLCPRSSTFWRNCAECGTPIEPDLAASGARTHPECTSEKGQQS